MQEQETEKIEGQKHRSFQEYVIRGDKMIWGIYLFLFVLSMLEIFSATSQLAIKSDYVSRPAFRHIEFLFGGLLFLLIGQRMGRVALKSWDKILFCFGVLFSVGALMFGVEQKGATRSIAGIQPVELCKIGVVMFLVTAITASDAAYAKYRLFRKNVPMWRFWVYFAIIVVGVGPIGSQNLSSGLIMIMSCVAVMFIGRVPGLYMWRLMFAGLIIVGFGALGLWIIHEQNGATSGLDRIETVDQKEETEQEKGWSILKWIDRSSTWANRIYDHSDKPLWEESINGKKSQELCAHMAIANSYPMGRSLGRSKLRDFLPEAFSDYIFSIIFEEWGILGALIVLLAYLSLFVRCFILSLRTGDMFLRLLIIGLSLTMVIQALMHIGVCTGAMYVTGQPLPLISRGGSSIIFTSLTFGIILAVSRLIQQEYAEKQKSALETVEAPQEQQE